MRRLVRPSLTKKTLKFLEDRRQRVANASDPVAEAFRLWRRQGAQPFAEIRRTLGEMAFGRKRCMYCEDSEGTDIDHFRPKAKYAHSAFDWNNFFLACSHCNSNQKRDQFPFDESGRPLLIDPSAEEPGDHLQLVPETGAFVGITTKGEVSISVFGLARQTLEQGRRDAWIVLSELLEVYGESVDVDRERASKIAAAVQRYPFSSVLLHLISTLDLPNGAALFPNLHRVLSAHPEIRSWPGAKIAAPLE